MLNYAELCICIKIMHLLGEFSRTTYLLKVVERLVNAAVGCKDYADVGSTTRGLIRRSG